MSCYGTENAIQFMKAHKIIPPPKYSSFYNQADRHNSRALSNPFPTDGRTDRPTKRLVESRARDYKYDCQEDIQKYLYMRQMI